MANNIRPLKLPYNEHVHEFYHLGTVTDVGRDRGGGSSGEVHTFIFPI
jgi:hypothetical protein